MSNVLLREFYTVLSCDFSSEKKEAFTCQVKLNPEHPVYKGHFGELPIAPGVCLVQMAKEILEKHLEKPLMLTEGDNIKFLALINPNETPELTILFQVAEDAGGYKVSATYQNNGHVYVKFKGRFRI